MRRKNGFSLVEIAIVLAVIGLVIGGIYVAASAVRENNRITQLQKQFLQIVSNVRRAYGNQNHFVALSHAQIKTLGIMPADIVDDGTTFRNAFGGPISLAVNPGDDQVFVLNLSGITSKACAALLSQNFGSAETVKKIGLKLAGAGDAVAGVSGTDIDLTNGITPVEVAARCTTSNTGLWFHFRLR